MTRIAPKTIILPQDPKAKEVLRRYVGKLQAIFPADGWISGPELTAVAVQVLMLGELFNEGLMVNTATFRESLHENNKGLFSLLEHYPYVFPEACADLAWKCAHVRTD